MRDRDDAPRTAPRSMASKGMINTNNKKVQRTMLGLVLNRTQIYTTFFGRIKGRVFSMESLVSICCMTVGSPSFGYARYSLSSLDEQSSNVTLSIRPTHKAFTAKQEFIAEHS
jgi:hypothetical protein